MSFNSPTRVNSAPVFPAAPKKARLPRTPMKYANEENNAVCPLTPKKTSMPQQFTPASYVCVTPSGKGIDQRCPDAPKKHLLVVAGLCDKHHCEAMAYGRSTIQEADPYATYSPP